MTTMAKRKPIRGRPPVNEITESQRRTLCEIQDFIAHKKYAPSMQELADALGITPASAHELVGQLERKGYVQRESRKARSLAVLRPANEQATELVRVPLVGRVAAGPPNLAEQNVIGAVDVESTVAKRGRCFALRVKGDSMKGAGLLDGYVVIVRHQPVAENGDIVGALVDGESTLKRLYIRGDQIELRPENRKYRPIVIDAGTEMTIVGKVVAVRRSIGV
jgi:repressor LexA